MSDRAKTKDRSWSGHQKLFIEGIKDKILAVNYKNSVALNCLLNSWGFWLTSLLSLSLFYRYYFRTSTGYIINKINRGVSMS
jgi:hypothetical protein